MSITMHDHDMFRTNPDNMTIVSQEKNIKASTPKSKSFISCNNVVTKTNDPSNPKLDILPSTESSNSTLNEALSSSIIIE